MKPHRGTLILVLGILSLVVCAPLGIVAWVMGNGDLKQMDAGAMDPTGRSLTNGGRICGMIGTILLALSILVLIALFALGFTLMIAVQALINISVALCLVPTKGLPLPLVSYGGSSLITSLIAVGMLLNLSQQSG